MAFVNMPARLKLLREVYRIYDRFISDFDLACKIECSTCCTRNITATSLEAKLLLDYCEKITEINLLESICAAAEAPRYQPRLTINRIADACAKGEDIPEETADPKAMACPLLRDGRCSVYGVRPFGCRAMVSQSDCSVTGEAEMPDFVLTVNNVILQYMEALDADGAQGNLIDIVLYLKEPRSKHLVVTKNLPLSVLMVPPEHRHRIQPVLKALSQAQRDSL